MAILFFFFLLLLLFRTITLHFLHTLSNLPPTPFPTLPIIGHLYFFAIRNRHLPFHRILSCISSRHGPIVFLRLGSRPVLLVSSPSAARECFTGSNDVVFANRPDYLLNGKHFGYNFTSLAWASYGPHWRNLRRISNLQLLSSRKLTTLSSIRANEVRSMVLKLLKLESTIIDMRKLFFEYTYQVVTGMISGNARCGEEEAEVFREIVEEMSRVTLEANVVDFLPLMRWIGLGHHVERKLRLVQEKRDKFMENVMEEWRRDDSGKDDKSFIQVLEDLHKAEPAVYTDETIRNLLLV